MSDEEPEAEEVEAAKPEPVQEIEKVDEVDEAEQQAAPVIEVASDADVERELRRHSRRGFLTFGVAALAGYAGWKWLDTRPGDDGIAWPVRRMLQFNERVAEAYFSPRRMSPNFAPSRVTPRRVNGNLGLDPVFDPSEWKLSIEGTAQPVSLTLDDIRSLPKRTMITELRCIEGWSVIVQWGGARLADLMTKFPPKDRVRFVGMETPDRGYYVGLDLPSAMHPQTLLAYEMNGAPLRMEHGAPLRLAIPVKYGIKNIKRIGTIRYTDVRPADFWAQQGYDWYAGH